MLAIDALLLHHRLSHDAIASFHLLPSHCSRLQRHDVILGLGQI